MALSVVDLYRDILPKTNCGDCGYPTCLAFASIVVSEKLPIENCPYLDENTVNKCRAELEKQYAAGKWLKRDMAADALEWAKKKTSSMKIHDLPDRIGGKLISFNGETALELPYFDDYVVITDNEILKKDGSDLTRWEKVFIYNHMAQGGNTRPSGKWKGLVEFPNTVSKMKSMINHVEIPMIRKFTGHPDELVRAALSTGGTDISHEIESADVALHFTPLPRVPVRVIFWDQAKEDHIEAEIKFMFDETITDHLDIESIMFLSERLKELLCGDEDA
ncbi:MAG: DUF3786 domain-containing protein [Desulfobacterales bacterium]|nr:DUF3786 domain-containing protein [Desulfobacterales bacterium]